MTATPPARRPFVIAVAVAVAVARGLLAASALCAGASAAADAGAVFDGYDAFYESLPARVFDRADVRAWTDVDGDPDEPRLAWTGRVAGVPGTHRIALRGTTPVVDGRALPLRPERRFAGAAPLPLGRQAVLHVAARAICVDGTPGSRSGTADRYAQVTLVLEPFGPRPTRLQLPSLFGACLGVARDASGHVRFLAAALRRAEGADEPEGVDFTPWAVEAGGFRRAGPVVRTSFVAPGNVFRFTVDAP